MNRAGLNGGKQKSIEFKVMEIEFSFREMEIELDGEHSRGNSGRSSEIY